MVAIEFLQAHAVEGKMWLAIITLSGDTLKECLSLAGIKVTHVNMYELNIDYLDHILPTELDL